MPRLAAACPTTAIRALTSHAVPELQALDSTRLEIGAATVTDRTGGPTMDAMEVRIEGGDRISNQLRRFVATNAMVRSIDLSAPLIMEALRHEAPYRDHEASDFSESAPTYRHLRDSFATVRHTRIGAVERVFTSDVPQARFTLEGTQGHDVSNRPEEGRTPDTPWRTPGGGQRTVLHWVSEGGDDVFVPRSAQPVHIPAQPPNPWNRKAWDAVRPVVVGRFVSEIRRELLG